jgi:hypothetical protein
MWIDRWRRAGAAGLMIGMGLISLAQAQGDPCCGDCNSDGAVTIDEILQGVNIAFDPQRLSSCPSIDRDANSEATVDEILAAVNAALTGCPPAESTPTKTATPTPSATITATASATVNLRPVVTPLPVYRTYAGAPIRLPIPVGDPEADLLSCGLTNLPQGAVMDGPPPLFAWTPRADQLGPFYVPFACAAPGAAATTGTLVFKVSPLDSCAIPVCDPATGCVSSIPSVNTTCCSGEPAARLAEPVADCPQGRVIFAGANMTSGFGRLQNCDRLRVVNAAQFSAAVRLHVEGRCINAEARPLLHARLQTAQRVVFDKKYRIAFTARDDGFSQILAVPFDVDEPRPFYDLQDAEANLTIDMTDADDVQVSQSLRLILTFTPIPDKPDLDVHPTPTATIGR